MFIQSRQEVSEVKAGCEELKMRREKQTSKDFYKCRPILVDAKSSSQLCGVGLSLWYQLDQQGHVPQAVRLHSKRLWNYDQIRVWANFDCPSRDSAVWQELLAKMQQVDNVDKMILID